MKIAGPQHHLPDSCRFGHCDRACRRVVGPPSGSWPESAKEVGAERAGILPPGPVSTFLTPKAIGDPIRDDERPRIANVAIVDLDRDGLADVASVRCPSQPRDMDSPVSKGFLRRDSGWRRHCGAGTREEMISREMAIWIWWSRRLACSCPATMGRGAVSIA